MSARKYVHYFSDPVPEGCVDLKGLLGGKGAGLKDMSLAGLSVPPGFTIVTDCCEIYLANAKKWPEGLDAEVRDNLRRLERETGRAFGRGREPLLVSVRSGAAVSMPGMMDTILNCGLHPALAADVGDTPGYWDVYLQFVASFARVVAGIEPESFDEVRQGFAGHAASRELAARYLDAYRVMSGRVFPTDPWDCLRECVNAVFDSWMSERAVAYRQRHDIRRLRGTAVNVQMMFPSEVSGVVFTRDPNRLSSNHVVIEASYGLGESVVSGDVSPDRFLVDRDTFAVDAQVGNKAKQVRALGGAPRKSGAANEPCLTGAELADLTRLALRVEAHFGHAVDMEFGWAGGRFGLLQSRRIRGLEIAEDVEIGRQEEIARLRNVSAHRHRCWVIHNLAETLRFPTHLTWDVVSAFMKGSGGFGRLYSALGYMPSQRVCRDGFLELICGRIYADPERLSELFWDAMPLAYDVNALVRDKSLLDRAPSVFDPQRADGRFLARLPATLWRMSRAPDIARRARRGARERFEKEVLPPYLEYVRANRAANLGALSDTALLDELNARRARVLDGFGPESLMPGFFGGMAYDGLAGMLERMMGRAEAGELARTLTRALDGDTTVAQDEMLHGVAHGAVAMPAFLDAFGHRCVGEMELAVPRWRENHAYLDQILRRMQRDSAASPASIHKANKEKRVEAQRELPAALRRCGGSVFRERLEQDLADAQALLPYRESGKHYLMMGYELIRLACEELARRWDLGGGIYYLRLDELTGFTRDRSELLERIEKRRVRHQAFQRLELPDVIDSAHLERMGMPEPVESKSEMDGTAVASGVSTGTAQIVFDPQEAGELGADYVLVCPSTDPGWTPLFMYARGLVVERGGVLSHGAIVARDFGIPAVVCPGATRLIRSGDRIRVDGNAGRITVIERAAGAA